MGAYVVEITAVAVLVLASINADRRLNQLPELPMQWGVDGKPAWYAPQRVTTAFMPTLDALILLATASKNSTNLGLAGVVAASVVSAHNLHLTLITRKLHWYRACGNDVLAKPWLAAR